MSDTGDNEHSGPGDVRSTMPWNIGRRALITVRGGRYYAAE
ncbi:hypothetical protein [Streptosporangium sp. V21-05]